MVGLPRRILRANARRMVHKQTSSFSRVNVTRMRAKRAKGNAHETRRQIRAIQAKQKGTDQAELDALHLDLAGLQLGEIQRV